MAVPLVGTDVLGGRESKLAEQSVLWAFCRVGRRGGRQLEGNPTNRHQREGEWICLQDGFSLYTLAIYYCHCLCWQVSLKPGFVPWGAQSCSSASLGSGGKRKSQKKITNKTEEQPQSNAFQVPFLLESQAHPGKKETRK